MTPIVPIQSLTHSSIHSIHSCPQSFESAVAKWGDRPSLGVKRPAPVRTLAHAYALAYALTHTRLPTHALLHALAYTLTHTRLPTHALSLRSDLTSRAIFLTSLPPALLPSPAPSLPPCLLSGPSTEGHPLLFLHLEGVLRRLPAFRPGLDGSRVPGTRRN